jgi:sRNA-binding protein
MTSREKPENTKGTSVKKSSKKKKSTQEQKDKTAGQLEKELREREEGRKQIQAAIDWLCKTFPECFNFKKPVPLKRAIEKDIFARMPKETHFSKNVIKAAIIYYTRNVRYQKAVHTYKHRFDLDGNLVDKIKQGDKEYAEKRIAWVEDKMRKASMPDKAGQK